jgi:hypothetical protein
VAIPARGAGVRGLSGGAGGVDGAVSGVSRWRESPNLERASRRPGDRRRLLRWCRRCSMMRAGGGWRRCAGGGG